VFGNLFTRCSVRLRVDVIANTHSHVRCYALEFISGNVVPLSLPCVWGRFSVELPVQSSNEFDAIRCELVTAPLSKLQINEIGYLEGSLKQRSNVVLFKFVQLLITQASL
jgi:hypothetical protein